MKHCLLLIILNIAIPKYIFADVSSIIHEKISLLENSHDSMITLNMGCNYCNTGTKASCIFFYKQGNQYYYEYYCWEIGSQKITKHIKSNNSSNKVKKLFQITSLIIDTLYKYNQETDLENYILSKTENDTATNGRFYSHALNHGIRTNYRIKFGDRLVDTTFGCKPNGNFFLKNGYYHVAILLFALSFFYNQNY